MRKNKFLSLALAIILSVNFVGCSGETQPSNSSAVTESSVSDITETQENAPYATITDHAGRQVVIEEKVDTIVSGYYITTSALIALGVEDSIIGIENKASSRPIYGQSAPHLLEVPGVGTSKEFDIETTMSLKPDLVILPLKLKDSATTLEELGVDVLLVNPESDAMLEETLIMLATATDTLNRANELIANSNDKLETLMKNENPPTVYLASNSDFLSTAGAKMYQNTVIENAGALNVASDIEDTYWATISYEQLIAYNPEHIIIAPAASYTVEDVLADENIQGVDAVINNQVYKMPFATEAWDSPLVSSYLGSMYIASVVNPDNYTHENFVDETVSFYKEYYDFELDSQLLN